MNVLGGTTSQSALVVFPTPCQVRRSSQFVITALLCSLLRGPGSTKLSRRVAPFRSWHPDCAGPLFLFKPALNNKLSGGPPESRRVAATGSPHNPWRRSAAASVARSGKVSDPISGLRFSTLEVSCSDNPCRPQSGSTGWLSNHK